MEPMAGGRSENVMVRLQKEVIQDIDARVKTEDKSSRSDYIRTALEKYMDPNIVFIEFTPKEISELKTVSEQNNAPTVEDYIKDIALTHSKRGIIQALVDESVCRYMQNPSRKEDLKDVVKELVDESIKQKFS